jgi:hypothetical protein
MGRTTLSNEEMKAHLANGRTILISPVYGKDEDGQMVEKSPGRHVTHASQLPGSLELAGDDPARLAAARAEAKAAADAAQKHLAEVEKAESAARRPEAAPPSPPAEAPKAAPAPEAAPAPAPAKAK